MGTWGEKLFSDDTACDVRDTYKEELRRSGSPYLAATATVASFKDDLDDPDDAPVVWLALAVTEHKLGYDTSTVTENARRILDDKLGLDRWREAGPKALAARLREYDRIQAVLDSPRPTPKPINRKSVRFEDCGLRPGDVFRIPLQAGASDFAYFRVIGTREERDAIRPLVVLLDHPPPNPDPPADLASAPALGVRNYGNPLAPHHRFKLVEVWGWNKRGAQAGVDVVGRCELRPDDVSLATKWPSQQDWPHLPEAARHSFDRTHRPPLKPEGHL